MAVGVTLLWVKLPLAHLSIDRFVIYTVIISSIIFKEPGIHDFYLIIASVYNIMGASWG
jgi:hypothetical protein